MNRKYIQKASTTSMLTTVIMNGAGISSPLVSDSENNNGGDQMS